MPAFVWVESRAAEPIIPLSLFRNRTFSVTSAVGFIVGFALFGAITYLPLYFQITKGASPTKSGLQLTPLMAGVLVTSIASGQLISRLGRYRMFPIAGTAMMALAMFLLSRLMPGTSIWLALARLARARARARHGDAGARARGAERRRLPRRSASRRAARRCSARSAARSASRSSGRSSPTGCTSSSRRGCRRTR